MEQTQENKDKHAGEGKRFKKYDSLGRQEYSGVQYCYECGTRLESIFKSHPKQTDTWFWLECDYCGDFFCPDCVEDEGDGINSCFTCCIDPNHDTHKEEKKAEFNN